MSKPEVAERQQRVLAVVRAHPGSTLPEIRARLGETAHTVDRDLAALARADSITRVRIYGEPNYIHFAANRVEFRQTPLDFLGVPVEGNVEALFCWSPPGPGLDRLLRAVRTRLGWSCADTARRLGVTQGELQALESPEPPQSPPDVGMLVRILIVCGSADGLTARALFGAAGYRYLPPEVHDNGATGAVI